MHSLDPPLSGQPEKVAHLLSGKPLFTTAAKESVRRSKMMVVWSEKLTVSLTLGFFVQGNHGTLLTDL